ncbi:MAG: hypothetical protein WAK48_24545 [Candidatus Acidiferrum sp.]|jgi:hypothetical protein
MKWCARTWLCTTVLAGLALGGSAPIQAQAKKPNVVFIVGDDIGWMQPSIYHRGLMVGETPNIEKELETYNLTQVIQQIKNQHAASHAGE